MTEEKTKIKLITIKTKEEILNINLSREQIEKSFKFLNKLDKNTEYLYEILEE